MQNVHAVTGFLQVALIVAALLIIETVWQTVANYSFLELESYTSPLQVFGGLALGKVLGILFLREWPRSWKFILALGSVCAGWMGIVYVPIISFFWLTIPFVGLGVLLVDLFSRESLWRLIVASGLVGVIFFAVFPFVSGMYVEELITISLVLLFIAVLPDVVGHWKEAIGSAVLVLAMLVLWQLGYATIPSSLGQGPNFAGARMVAPPEVNLLFRTDLMYLPSIERHVLVMNGSRYMVVPTHEHIDSKLEQPFALPNPTSDTPYLFGKQFEKVLVIGPAGGRNVLSALAFGASSVVGVDINPAVFSFLKDQRPDLLDNLYLDPRVKTVRMEGRHFLETTDEKFDLIVMQGVQTGTQVQNSSTALLESFLFTEEALEVMWERLNDDGAIFFDEYDARLYLHGALTNLALIARDRLPLTDPEQQIFLHTYRQRGDNPTGVLQRRAGLMLWKTPVTGDKDAIQSNIAQTVGVDFKTLKPTDLPKSVTDDRPIFVQELGFQTRTLLVIGAFMGALVIALFLMRYYGTREEDSAFRPLYIGMAALGAAYILCVMSFWGPIVLLTGEPFVVGPLVYFGLYFFGLVGGLVALRLRRFSVPVFFAIGCFGVLFAWFLLSKVGMVLLGSESMALRYTLGFAAISILALCFELPYITALKVAERVRRGELYTYGALGALFGAGVSLIVQPAFGFNGSMGVGFALLIVAGYFFYKARRLVA